MRILSACCALLLLVACDPNGSDEDVVLVAGDAGVATDAGTSGTQNDAGTASGEFTFTVSGCPHLDGLLSGTMILENTIVDQDPPASDTTWCQDITDRQLSASYGGASAALDVKIEGNTITLTSAVSASGERTASAGFADFVIKGRAAGLTGMRAVIQCSATVDAPEPTMAGAEISNASGRVCGIDAILNFWDPANHGELSAEANGSGEAELGMSIATTAIAASVDSTFTIELIPEF